MKRLWGKGSVRSESIQVRIKNNGRFLMPNRLGLPPIEGDPHWVVRWAAVEYNETVYDKGYPAVQ
jgi:hypothetical protein